MTQQTNIKLPGETDPDFSKLVSDYLKRFNYHKIERDYARREDIHQWCANNLGEQYKDWFISEGGRYDKCWIVNIREPKKSMWFVLRWNDIILESVDRQSR